MTLQTVQLAAACACWLAVAPSVPRAQAPGAAPVPSAAEAPPGRISGRVVAAETGLPLRRAAVSITSQATPAMDQMPAGQATMTDDDGGFAFAAVAPGRYDLRVAKSRYLWLDAGRRRPGWSGRTIDVAAGQRVENLTLTLALAGAITGRVLDEAGEPVAEAMVMAMRFSIVSGERRLGPTGNMRHTDDTGAFRLYGLRPGRYYVAARPPETRRYMQDTLEAGVTGHATTYYPSTPVAAEAQIVEVTAGAEAAADITLFSSRLARVSGVVVDASGRPALGGMVMAKTSLDGAITMGPDVAASVRDGGTFTVSGLVPGEYTLHVRAYFDEADMTSETRSGRVLNDTMPVQISVRDGNVDDLRIVVPPPVSIPGRVHFEGGAPPAAGTARITAVRSPGLMSPSTAETDRDGRFTLQLRPGTWRLSTNAPPGWMVKRVEVRGREVDPDDDVDIPAEPGTRIDLVLTNRITVVAGTVHDDHAQPVRNCFLMVFPRHQPEAGAIDYRRTRVARGGDDGRFRFEGLPPGDYLAIALPELDPETGMDEDGVAALRAAATPLRVAAAQTQTLMLTLASLP